MIDDNIRVFVPNIITSFLFGRSIGGFVGISRVL